MKKLGRKIKFNFSHFPKTHRNRDLGMGKNAVGHRIAPPPHKCTVGL